MEADFQKLILWILQAVGAGFCYILWLNFRDLKTVCEAIGSALAAHKLHVAENYVTQNDLGRAIDALTRSLDAVFKKLDRIEEKFDHKQDKTG